MGIFLKGLQQAGLGKAWSLELQLDLPYVWLGFKYLCQHLVPPRYAERKLDQGREARTQKEPFALECTCPQQ